jgi:hypothetical protein
VQKRVWHYSAVFPRSRRQRAPIDPGISWLTKLLLLARVWVIAVQIQLVLRRRPLPEVVLALGAPSADRHASIALLSRAVSRGLRVGPWQPRCLLRALVLYRLLRAQGDAAELIIGLPNRPTNEEAHAWVELAGRDVGPAPGGSGYEEFTRFPREGRPTSRPVHRSPLGQEGMDVG